MRKDLLGQAQCDLLHTSMAEAASKSCPAPLSAWPLAPCYSTAFMPWTPGRQEQSTKQCERHLPGCADNGALAYSSCPKSHTLYGPH
jgi:hypothetical protein